MWMKEEGILEVKWIATDDYCSDLFTKNLARPAFEKHAEVNCGHDPYMSNNWIDAIQWEGVRSRKKLYMLYIIRNKKQQQKGDILT